MTRILAALALAFTAALASPAMAETACPQHYLDGRPPTHRVPAAGVVEMCNDAFSDLYDPAGRTVIYAAEHVTPASLAEGVNLERANSFHADPRLKHDQSAHPEDYAGSDYDRGHMAPDHDMPTAESKRQSDSLANVVPQDPASNRGLWAHVERAARRATVLASDGYIVSGPIFDGDAELVNGRIPVPTRLFKAFYRPAGGVEKDALVGVWVVENAPNSPLEEWPLDRLRDTIGLDAFPSLSEADHARVSLPPVTAR